MSTAAQRQLLVEKFLTVIPRQVCILSKDLWRILKSAPKAVKIFGSIWAKNIFSSGTFAVRSERSEYLGVFEVTQNIRHI